MPPGNQHGADDNVPRPRHDDADRFDAVDAGVGGIQGAGNAIEPDLAADVLLEILSKGVVRHEVIRVIRG
jgi:hypothetical protein